MRPASETGPAESQVSPAVSGKMIYYYVPDVRIEVAIANDAVIYEPSHVSVGFSLRSLQSAPGEDRRNRDGWLLSLIHI